MRIPHLNPHSNPITLTDALTLTPHPHPSPSTLTLTPHPHPSPSLLTLIGQKDGDELDYRGLLNRDGSVLTAITVDELKQPQALYSSLGCKTVVGLPFKDISTSDALLLREPPGLDDAEARQTLRRMMDVAILPIVPADALAAAPIEGAVALLTLEEAVAGKSAPECAKRTVLSVRGDEEPSLLAKLKELEHAFVLLDPPPTLSRALRVRE